LELAGLARIEQGRSRGLTFQEALAELLGQVLHRLDRANKVAEVVS